MAVIFRYKLYHHQTENVCKISSLNSYRRYTQENKQSSLLDFNPLLRDGVWRGQHVLHKENIFIPPGLPKDRFVFNIYHMGGKIT